MTEYAINQINKNCDEYADKYTANINYILLHTVISNPYVVDNLRNDIIHLFPPTEYIKNHRHSGQKSKSKNIVHSICPDRFHACHKRNDGVND